MLANKQLMAKKNKLMTVYDRGWIGLTRLSPVVKSVNIYKNNVIIVWFVFRGS